jgi:hypothetical protein
MVMMVYVVMGNDYPAAVFDNESDAAAYCLRKKVEGEKRRADGNSVIYWRAYGFPLNQGA